MKSQYKAYREALILYFNAPFFWFFSHFQKYLNPQVRTNKLVNCCLPLLSFKISLRDTSFRISLNSSGFYLSRMLVEFSLTCVGKMFQFMVFTFVEKAFNVFIFTHAPSLPRKTPGRIFWKSVPQDKKGGGNYDLLHQTSFRKYEDDLEH